MIYSHSHLPNDYGQLCITFIALLCQLIFPNSMSSYAVLQGTNDILSVVFILSPFTTSVENDPSRRIGVLLK